MTDKAIKKIQKLENAGIFEDISARSGSIEFKKYNLIYGFNGSGKTTFSRILASYETGELSPNLPADLKCELECSFGKAKFEPGKKAFGEHLVVFNADYVARAFEWRQGAARAEGILYIGRDQADAAREREEKEKEFQKLDDALPDKREAAKALEKTFNTEAKRIGDLIASDIGRQRNYNAGNVKKDYESLDVGSLKSLTDTERNAFTDILRQNSPLPKIMKPLALDPDGSKVFDSGYKALEQTVGAAAFEDLARHPEMVGWVKQGADYHQDQKLDQCLHCGNSIDQSRIAAIKKQFDNSFEKVVAAIDGATSRASGSEALIKALIENLPAQDEVASVYRAEYVEAGKLAKQALDSLQDQLSHLQKALAMKRQSPTSSIPAPKLINPAQFTGKWDEAKRALSDLLKIIDKHNQAFDEFNKQQDETRKAIITHHLKVESDAYFLAKTNFETASSALEAAESARNQIDAKIKELTQQMQEAAPAAERINTLLHDYLGHKEITLAPLETGEPGFEVRRHGKPLGGPPSEGERTALALCHFLTALNANGRDVSQVIVVIDDPISSLDTRAQSHALALIKEHVGAAAQIFISTHHFHFATEVRRWLGYLGKKIRGQYFVETVSLNGVDRRHSRIVKMPSLLEKYNSEYAYLFDIVFDYSAHRDGQTENAFLMPNAIRKLMEAFFSFKLPDVVDDDGKVNLHKPLTRAKELWPQITQEDISVLDRVVNIASHGRMQSHEGLSLPTIEEAHRAAKIAIKLIETCDAEHAAGLKRAVGKAAA